MKLEKILSNIEKYIGKIEKKRFSLSIKVDTERINSKTIYILYFLLNNYEDLFFITIENVPYCLMPDAGEHLLYLKTKKGEYSKDKTCNLCCLNNTCPGWGKSINTDKIRRIALKDKPKEIMVEVTKNCNLNCKTCTSNQTNAPDINLRKVKNIIKECKDLNIKAIRFTGGEPLLNKNIDKILKLAKKNGLYVLLNTNATIINDRILKLLRKM